MTEKKIETGRCKVVAVSDIFTSEFNARDQEIEPPTSEKFVELCDSVRSEGGLIEPLVVRETDHRYEVIAGTRRLRALRHIGVKETTVIIRNMEDNDVRIASLVENIHRDDLLENEKEQTLKEIYLATWDEWKPAGIESKMMPARDKRTGEVTTYDPNTTDGKLHLAQQFLNKLGSSDIQNQSPSKGYVEFVKPTKIFKELRERIGYKAKTQYHILRGQGSGSTTMDYFEEMPLITRKKFQDDLRLKELEEEEARELAKKLREEAKKKKKYEASLEELTEKATDKFLKKRAKRKKKEKEQKEQEEEEEEESETESKEHEPKPHVEKGPEREQNPVRAREAIISKCVDLFKILTGMDLYTGDLEEGERQAKSHDAKMHMKEIATFYLRERELANLQYIVIPTNQALTIFRDLIYESAESEKRKDDLLKP